MEINPENKNTLYVHYHITRACNNRCSYCYVLDELNNKQLLSPYHDQVIDAITDATKRYKVVVYVLGGEPLLVVDRVADLCNTGAEVIVYSNLNFAKLPVLPNVTVIGSWHETSRGEWVKQNLLSLMGRVEASLLLTRDNLPFVSECASWCKEAGIPYNIAEVRDGTVPRFTDVTNPLYIQAYTGSLASTVDNTIDLMVSYRYFVECYLAEVAIFFDGMVRSNCTWPLEHHIRDGLHITKVLCSNHHCKCGGDSYKRTLRKK